MTEEVNPTEPVVTEPAAEPTPTPETPTEPVVTEPAPVPVNKGGFH